MDEAIKTTCRFSLPAEWTEQDAVLLTWPHRATIWADTLTTIDAVFVQIAAAIAQREKVIISCFDAAHREHITTLLTQANILPERFAIFIAPCDDIWVRDHGPITVMADGKPLLLDFIFNGWGNKYPCRLDNIITKTLHAQKAFGDTPRLAIDKVLEGGAIEVDGQGTLLTTSRCLLAKTRNANLTQADISTLLQTLFGLKKILWLHHGHLDGDDTDGHIDTLARFTDENTICYTACDDVNDEHFATLQAMEKELQSFRNDRGQPYRLIPLPWPRARYADYDGRRLPLTYANFLLINGAVLVPTYDDVADEKALAEIGHCFPDRDIIAIPSLALVQWYGSLHCMTMQLPKGVL